MSTVSSNAEVDRWSGADRSRAATQRQALATLLHIRSKPPEVSLADQGPQGDDRADWMNPLLDLMSHHVVCCPDVYLGLARLLKPGSHDPAAVLVCVDELTIRELEFFSLVSRLRPSVPTYVYGQPRSHSRVARAIELGATDRATEGSLRSLYARIVEPESPVGGADTAPETSASEPLEALDSRAPDPALPVYRETRVSTTAAGITPPAEPAMPSPPPAEEVSFLADPTDGSNQEHPASDQARVDLPVVGGTPSEDVPSEPVRVPWLRDRTDRPVRRGPKGRVFLPPKREVESEGAGEGASQAAPYEPLLTEEELRALMGHDDIAALAPPERDPPGLDETAEGSAGA